VICSFASRDIGATQICWSVIADERGIIYVGSDNVLTFDGEIWRPHKIPDSYAVRAMAIGAQGRLWVGAMNEIGYFDRTPTGDLGPYQSLTTLLPAGTTLGDVWHVFSHGTGAVFVTSDSVLVWNGESFRIDRRPGARRLAAMKAGDRIFVDHPLDGMWSVEADGLRCQQGRDLMDGGNARGLDFCDHPRDGKALVRAPRPVCS